MRQRMPGKKHRSHVQLLVIAAGLVVFSTAILLAVYARFGRGEDVLFYTLLDIAFVPLEVVLVALIIERVLALRERRQLLEKLNMVIGAFFSEVGTQLLGALTAAIADREKLLEYFDIREGWSGRDFQRAMGLARKLDYQVKFEALDLEDLRETLVRKREFLVRLLENPNLLEHERFTDLLWAVFHLTEELTARKSLRHLPPTDAAHLANDARRAYEHLVIEWLAYCRHLQESYPYIFSLVLRTHPLQAHPDATVRK